MTEGTAKLEGMTLSLWLSLAAALSALLAIASDWHRRHPSFYLFKPLTTGLLIAVAALALAAAPPEQQSYRIGLLVGLGFCLLGDVLLMPAGTRWFAAGLTAFLFGHLAIAQAFWKTLPDPLWPECGWALALYGLLLTGFLLPRAGRLAPAVLLYCLALMAMVLLAAARAEQLGGAGPQLTLAGALLFALSDSILALRRFWRPWPGGQAMTLSTYYLAIGCLAWGA